MLRRQDHPAYNTVSNRTLETLTYTMAANESATLNYDPELAAILAANPAFTQAPPPPPPGVSEWDFARQMTKIGFGANADYYKERLPDRELSSDWLWKTDLLTMSQRRSTTCPTNASPYRAQTEK